MKKYYTEQDVTAQNDNACPIVDKLSDSLHNNESVDILQHQVEEHPPELKPKIKAILKDWVNLQFQSFINWLTVPTIIRLIVCTYYLYQWYITKDTNNLALCYFMFPNCSLKNWFEQFSKNKGESV